MAQAIGSLDLSTLNNLYDETQYFWFESSAQPWGAGAHVTLYPQSEFTTSTHANYLKGQNILMNTDGLSIRNGTLPMMTLDNDSLDFNVINTTNQTYTNVASFGSVSTIGVTNNTQSYMQLDYHSLQMIDKEGDSYFYVSDLRDSSGNAHIVETIESSGNFTSYRLSYVCNTNEPVSVYENGVLVSPSNYTIGYNQTLNVSRIDFNYTPAAGEIVVDYYSNSQNTKAFTMGIRTGVVGANSFAEGTGITASGIYSHAEGFNTVAKGTSSHSEGFNSIASGTFSHAEGSTTKAAGNASHAQNLGTIAGYAYQTAIGYFNDNKPINLFEIGYGVDDSARENVFEVSRYGDVITAGDITVKNHASPIGTRKVTTGSYSVASGSDYVTVPTTGLTRLSLEAGSWIITLSAQFGANATGRRGCAIYNVTASTRFGRSEVNQTAVSGAQTKLQTSVVAVLDTTSTITVQLSQNSGAARTCDLVLDAMRIA